MATYSATLRAVGDPVPLAATVKLEHGQLSLAAGDHPIGTWELSDIEFERTPNGYKMSAEGDQIIIEPEELDAFREALANGRFQRRGELGRKDKKAKKAEEKAAKNAAKAKKKAEKKTGKGAEGADDAPEEPTVVRTAEPRPVSGPQTPLATPPQPEPESTDLEDTEELNLPEPEPETKPKKRRFSRAKAKKEKKAKAKKVQEPEVSKKEPDQPESALVAKVTEAQTPAWKEILTTTLERFDKLIEWSDRKFGGYLPDWLFSRGMFMILFGVVVLDFFFPALFIIAGVVIVGLGAAAYADSVIESRMLPGRTQAHHALAAGAIVVIVGILITMIVG
ncbi:MAG TPA: hypothetical protein VE569_12760 [Acidimicrobiia bacterium]|nr:hypothetical protein [Acidimicrobiia bacterium]